MTMTPGDELIEQVRASLDADEAEQQPYMRGVWLPDKGGGHDPAFAMREIAVLRAIVDRCEEAIEAQGIYMEDGQEDLALAILRHVAEIYG